MISLQNIHKQYLMGKVALPVLNGVSLEIEEGEFVAIMGASGSGKTTLLNIIGCLDVIDNGEYVLAGQAVHSANDNQLTQLRSQHIGFVFQLFNLIPRINALRNIEIPMIYSGIAPAERKTRALEVLQQMDIADRANHVPAQLSGGQQQRVAIARALVNKPEILVADEPTGSLDSKTGTEIMQLFQQLNRNGMTIIMVTHEQEIAEYAQRIVTMQDGLVINE